VRAATDVFREGKVSQMGRHTMRQTKKRNKKKRKGCVCATYNIIGQHSRDTKHGRGKVEEDCTSFLGCSPMDTSVTLI